MAIIHPVGMTLSELIIEIGNTGAPALCAILKAPALKFVMRPSRDLVPSGKVARLYPSCIILHRIGRRLFGEDTEMRKIITQFHK